MLNTAREDSLSGSGVSKCEEATGLISPGQTHNQQASRYPAFTSQPDLTHGFA